MSDIIILRDRIAAAELQRLVRDGFGDMVKYVIDLERESIAIGGELHADAESVLLADGSLQRNVWGANYYPGLGPDDCIEFTSLINIRPGQGNPGMEIGDPAIRARVQELTYRLIGMGEAL